MGRGLGIETVTTEHPWTLTTRLDEKVVRTQAHATRRYVTVVEAGGETLAIAESAGLRQARERHIRAVIELACPSPLGWSIGGRDLPPPPTAAEVLAALASAEEWAGEVRARATDLLTIARSRPRRNLAPWR
jgi:hypothetical protein